MAKLFRIIGRVGLGLGLALPPLLGVPASGQEGAPTISVDVNLVILHATVRDRRGGFVSDLTLQDFHVFENGRPQTIHLFRHEDVPVSVGLIVDSSTSMGPKRPDVAAAAVAFVRASNPQDELFVENFNEHVRMGLPDGTLFSSRAEDLDRGINDAPAGGKTALYDAIEQGLEHLKLATRDKKVLIVFSDGGDNASHAKLTDVLAQAERSDVIIYTIGLFDEDDADKNPGVLRKIAHTTGGEVYLPSESKDAVSICERIAADIRHQYTIGYFPSEPATDNSFRAIKVTASSPHGGSLLVRTREGYLARAH